MAKQFRVGVIVPVADEASAALVTQKLQEATTATTATTTTDLHIGAWVVRQREGAPFSGRVLVDFTVQADTLVEAQARALDWTRAALVRGNVIAGAGEPESTDDRTLF